MYLKKLSLLLFISFFVSSCVLIQESKNKTKLANVEYEKVYEEVKDTFKNTVEDNKIITEKNNLPTLEDTDKIWYHPNPWWRIASKPFPVSKDSFKYIRNGPQYGFSLYIDPISKQSNNYTWGNWKIKNYQKYEDGLIIHVWQAFISLYKETFSKHPEYLAEIDGKRLGYGKSNKLCVSNKNVQNLFIEYTKDRILKNPEYKIFSVEPSDGGSFCTCVNCSQLGSVSNQVFYFANQVAKEIKKTHPDKQLGLYAYNLHSDPPTFKVEDNVKIVLAPQGFQTNYSSMGMMKAWIEEHQNLGEREYFGIPQWTGDQPRIVIQEYINRVRYAQTNHFDMIIFETGTNLNATLLMTLLSQIMMNPSLTWEKVYEKFLNDCFKESKVPIKRLLDRWHSSDNFKTSDINYSLYDLNEASQLAKNSNEVQRIRDLKAYLHFLILYEEWNKDRKNTASLKNYFDYLYNSSNRNIVNVVALTRIFAKTYSSDKVLKLKYTYNTSQQNNWIKYITDQDIEANFQKDLKSYPPIFKEKISNQEIKNIAKRTSPQLLLDNYESPLKARAVLDIYSSNKSITIIPTYTQKDIQTMLSIYSKEGIFVEQRLLNDNESWTVQLPEPGVYTIMQNRVALVQINIKGKFSPILSVAPKKNDSQHTTRTINKKLELEPLDREKPIDETNSIYIITK